MLKKFMGFFAGGAESKDAEPAPEETGAAAGVVSAKEYAENLPGAGGPGSAPEDGAGGASAFMGEHLESLGDAWAALFEDTRRLEDLFPSFVREGAVRPDCETRAAGGVRAALVQYPAAGGVRAGSLVVDPGNGGAWHVASIYPVLEGLPNVLTVTGRHTWGNGFEGVVAASRTCCGPSVSFYAPLYFRDAPLFAQGEARLVDLAGLALSLAPADVQEFSVDKGALYEAQLEAYLRDNPGAGRDDFGPVTVSLRGSRLLFPREYAAMWEFRCPVLEAGETEFCDERLHRLTVIFSGYGNEEMAGYLYASEHVLDGYIPKAGDDIQGVLWMTGKLSGEVADPVQ